MTPAGLRRLPLRLTAYILALVTGLALVGAAAPAQAKQQPVVRVLVLARPTAVVATVGQHHVAAGRLPVAGRVSPAVAGRVVLQRHVGGTWADLAKATLSRSGAWTLTATGLRAGRYSLRVVAAAVPGRRAVASSTFAVTVLPPRAVPVAQPAPPAPTAPAPTPPAAIPAAPAPQTVPVPAAPVAQRSGETIQCSDFPPPTAAAAGSPTLAVVSPALGYVGTAFSAGLWINGGVAPYYVTAAGPVPAGLSMQSGWLDYPDRLDIEGLPTAAGVVHLPVTIVDADGAASTADICLQFADPLRVVTPPLPLAAVGAQYAAPSGVEGGFAPVAVSTGGPVQTAESLYIRNNQLVGNPDLSGIFSIPITAADANGAQFTDWSTLTVGPLPAARTIHVPGDVATISAAVAAARTGDTVLVAPGTYDENVDFAGKAITVLSSDGPAHTVIDGGTRGSTITFDHQEPPQAVLQGFTIRGGSGSPVSVPNDGSGTGGGGIFISGASPTIVGNVVTGAVADHGSGIGVFGGAPVVTGNTVTASFVGADGSIDGEGVYVTGATQLSLVDNAIKGNVVGINAIDSQQISTEGNLLTGNTSTGLMASGLLEFTSVDDAFVHNGASTRPGPVQVVPGFGGVASMVNDTIADNGTTALDTGVGVSVRNSVLENTSYLTPMVNCDDRVAPPLYSHDVIWTTVATDRGLGADCAELGTDNVVEDPQFVDPAHGDFSPAAGSPLVDAGALEPGLPTTDVLGNPRVVDGNADGVAAVDIGAYERQGS